MVILVGPLWDANPTSLIPSSAFWLRHGTNLDAASRWLLRGCGRLPASVNGISVVALDVSGLHQCIVDFATLIQPHLTIVDATRILVTNGPRGPGDLETPNQLIFGTDPVAVDAYAATLFRKEPFAVPYVKLAHEAGLGCGDLARIDVQHLEA